MKKGHFFNLEKQIPQTTAFCKTKIGQNCFLFMALPLMDLQEKLGERVERNCTAELANTDIVIYLRSHKVIKKEPSSSLSCCNGFFSIEFEKVWLAVLAV